MLWRITGVSWRADSERSGPFAPSFSPLSSRYLCRTNLILRPIGKMAHGPIKLVRHLMGSGGRRYSESICQGSSVNAEVMT